MPPASSPEGFDLPDSPGGEGSTPPGRPIRLNVSPAGKPDVRWELAGDLYLPAEGAAPSTVQVLLPGLTYDRRYWTIPGPNNYAHHMARAGYAVLALDRIGTGQSSRPPALEVNTDNHVAVLHQVIQALRAGEIADLAFSGVVVVGHSYGSGIAIVEAAVHQDVDALIVSGMLHTTAPLYEKVREFFHPASEDPVLAPTAPPEWPEWYMTQRPGFRATMLEYAENIDPRMSRYNELIKSTATLGEGESLPQTYAPEYSRAVRVPVLLVVGQHDALFCGEQVGFGAVAGPVHDFEKSFYHPDASLETHVIPRSGHSLNLHANAPEWFEIARHWMARWPGAAMPDPVTSAS